MRRVEYPEPLQRLVAQLKRLPGIGPRSAERIALWLVGGREHGVRGREVADAVLENAARVRPCVDCGFFTVEEHCEICRDPARESGPLCVVEQATDILPLERTGVFRGRYHALGGRLAPLDHIGPEDLSIERLLERLRAEQPTEIILALGADVEGEATAQYLGSLLAEFPTLENHAHCPGPACGRRAGIGG